MAVVAIKQGTLWIWQCMLTTPMV